MLVLSSYCSYSYQTCNGFKQLSVCKHDFYYAKKKKKKNTTRRKYILIGICKSYTHKEIHSISNRFPTFLLVSVDCFNSAQFKARRVLSSSFPGKKVKVNTMYIELHSPYHIGPVKRICVFEHSVITNFNCACPAIQRGQGSGFLSEGSS